MKGTSREAANLVMKVQAGSW